MKNEYFTVIFVASLALKGFFFILLIKVLILKLVINLKTSKDQVIRILFCLVPHIIKAQCVSIYLENSAIASDRDNKNWYFCESIQLLRIFDYLKLWFIFRTKSFNVKFLLIFFTKLNLIDLGFFPKFWG